MSTDIVSAICLPRQPALKRGNEFIFTGWGSPTKSTSISGYKYLKKRNIVIKSQCSEDKHENYYKLCANSHRTSPVSCRGDTGGPLVRVSSYWWTIFLIFIDYKMNFNAGFNF